MGDDRLRICVEPIGFAIWTYLQAADNERFAAFANFKPVGIGKNCVCFSFAVFIVIG